MKNINKYIIRYVCGGNLLDVFTTYVDGKNSSEVGERFFSVVDGTYYDILDIVKVGD